MIVVLMISNHVVGFPSMRYARLFAHNVQSMLSGRSDSSQSHSGTATKDDETVPGSKKEQVGSAPTTYSQESLTYQVCHLTLDGEDLSLPESDVTVEASQGHVQVIHTLSDQEYDFSSVAGNAALRAAALSNDLSGSFIQGNDDEEAGPFEYVTWIVCNSAGEAYLAVRFDAGEAPSSGDGITVLTQAQGYRMSESLYNDLGGIVLQETPESMSLLSGEEVQATATVESR